MIICSLHIQCTRRILVPILAASGSRRPSRLNFTGIIGRVGTQRGDTSEATLKYKSKIAIKEYILAIVILS
jgi:hypothetical protein